MNNFSSLEFQMTSSLTLKATKIILALFFGCLLLLTLPVQAQNNIEQCFLNPDACESSVDATKSAPVTAITPDNNDEKTSIKSEIREEPSATTSSPLEQKRSKINQAKSICAEIGFEAGTPDYGKCVLKMMDN